MKKRRERPNRVIDIDGVQRKISRIIDSSATDIHHIMGRKYKQMYNVNIEENKVRIPRKDHVDYNNFVKDKQNPREAMQKMYEMCKQVLADNIRAMLVEILYNTEDSDFYIPELLKWKKKKNTTNTATDQTDANTI